MLLPYFQKQTIEAGCDEAGRGCLAGPVFAAAVILPPGFAHPLLNDSKKLSARDRFALRAVIEKEAIAWAVAHANPDVIDAVNIQQASFLCMHQAVEKLHPKPGLLLIDGNRFVPYPGIAHQCVVGGDGRYAAIAAASILAKTYRDDFMMELHHQAPQYNWAQNKGYPTRDHREALNRFGPSSFHRRSFRLDYATTA